MLKRTLALLLAWMLVHASAIAAPRTVRATWEELAPLVTGRKVAMVLPDGTHLQGTVREVTADALVLETGKGSVSVPRASVTTLRRKTTGYKGKVIGTGIGLAAGLALALPIRAYANNEGANWSGIIAGAIAVPTALGFVAGHSIDRKTTDIVVEPDR